MQQRASTSLVHYLISFCHLPLSNFNSSSGISSRMSLGWPWASSGNRTQEDAPVYPGPGYCECCITKWWHSDMGVMGSTMCSIILHSVSFTAPRHSLCPRGPGCSPCPWGRCTGHSSCTHPLPLGSQGPTSCCYSSIGLWQSPTPQPRQHPYQLCPSVPELMPIRSCREKDWRLDLSGYKPFSWGIRGLISATPAWLKAKVKPEP